MIIEGIILALLLGIDAIWDIRCRKLPDVVAVLIVLLCVVSHSRGLSHVFDNTVWDQRLILSCLLGAVLFGLPILIMAFFRPGAFGGGDIKLAFSGGFLMGAVRTLTAFAVSFLAAGIVMAIWRLIKKPVRKERGFPFGPFLALGILVGFFFG